LEQWGVRQAIVDCQTHLSIDKRHRAAALLSATSTLPHINGDSRPSAIARQVAHPPSVLYPKTAPLSIHQRASQPDRSGLGPDRVGRAVSAVGWGSERASHASALWPWAGITAQCRDLFLFSFDLNKIPRNI
jgi:hypothetical protein